MVNHPAADGRTVSHAAALLSAGTDYAGLPSRLFQAVASVVDADLISYNEVNLATGEARFVLKAKDQPGSPPKAAPFLRRFGYHPAALAAVGGPSPDGVPHFVRDPKLRSLGVGNCCGVAEMRLENALSLSDAGSRLVGVGISRAVRDFDAGDEAMLAAIQPLMVEAVRNAIAATRTPPATPALPTAPRLTRRESEVLYWVSMGKTNEEIAIIVGARPMTVKKHLEHVYEKLEVPNRTAAAMAARGLPGGAELLLGH